MTFMTPTAVRDLRRELGLTQKGLALLLRLGDPRTVRRWESGDVALTGPASLLLELLAMGRIPKTMIRAASKES
jgi:DNA-binding transcriptional regulator YiaG